MANGPSPNGRATGSVRDGTEPRAGRALDEQSAAFDAVVGHVFADAQLRDAARTHPTWCNEHPEAPSHYERLEFLGDAVLALLASQALMQAFPTAPEGLLSRRRAWLVRQESLADVATNWGLEPFVRVGQGQRAAGIGPSILADVLEAVLGAVWLDGGRSACEALFTQHFAGPLAALETLGGANDAKTELQELCHRLELGPPRYNVVAVSGPAHARSFRIRLNIAGQKGAICALERVGSSKKRAEQACAAPAVAELRDNAARRRQARGTPPA